MVAIVDQRPISHLTTIAWLPRLFSKQMFETIPLMRRNFTLGFLKHLLRSVSELTKKDLLIRSIGIALNLSKYIWQLKYANITPVVTWRVVSKVFSDTEINFCILCLTEKVFIINALNDNQLLNKRSELINTCRHGNKLLLKCLKNKKWKTLYHGLEI